MSSDFISYKAYEQERADYIQRGKTVSDALINQLSTPFSGSIEELLGYSASLFFEFQGVQQIIVFDVDFKEIFAVNEYELISGWQDINSKKAKFERETDQAFYFTAQINKGDEGSAAYLMIILDKSLLSA